MKETIKNKLKFSIDYYSELGQQEENPTTYTIFLYGQAKAYENILKWIIQEELEIKEI